MVLILKTHESHHLFLLPHIQKGGALILFDQHQTMAQSHEEQFFPAFPRSNIPVCDF